MKLFILDNKKQANKKAFLIIQKQILKKPNSLIGLAAGKTTDGLYKLISKNAKASPNKWKKLKLLQIDENLDFSPDSPKSFNFEIRQELRDLIKLIKKGNVFLMDSTRSTKETKVLILLFLGLDLHMTRILLITLVASLP